MAVTAVPNLEYLLLQKECLLKNPTRNVPKAIGFAGVNIWLPKYIKRGCEQFIEEIEGQFFNGTVDFLATEDVSKVALDYLSDLAEVNDAQAAYFATDEVMMQKRKNLRDSTFILIAKLTLEQSEMTESRSYEGVINALIAANSYFNGKLN